MKALTKSAFAVMMTAGLSLGMSGCCGTTKAGRAAAPVLKASQRPEEVAYKGKVLPGIDVLEAKQFAELKGKRVGLITNHTGFTRDKRTTIDVLHENKDVNLVALFSPEHGIRGTEDTKVDSTVDEKTGLQVYSLYGKTRKPTPEMLEGIDVFVFDIQDIGTRFYTYIGTMALAMQAAKEAGKEIIVLDRPNSIGGDKVEGAVISKEGSGGITAIYPIPTRHGMTVGELALLFNDHFEIGANLTVIPMENWRRWMYLDDTGLLWVNPSPNMKTLAGAILYPGMGAAETTTLSPGRGTDRPFEMYGAPFMDGPKLAAALNERNIPGVNFAAWSFTPTAQYHQFKDEQCHGIFAVLYDRDALDSVLAGLHMVQVMYQQNPEQYKALGGFKTSSGSEETWKWLTEDGLTPEQVVERWKPELDAFMAVRSKYLLYGP